MYADVSNVTSHVLVVPVLPILRNKVRRYVSHWVYDVSSFNLSTPLFRLFQICALAHALDNVVDRIFMVEDNVLRGAFSAPASIGYMLVCIPKGTQISHPLSITNVLGTLSHYYMFQKESCVWIYRGRAWLWFWFEERPFGLYWVLCSHFVDLHGFPNMLRRCSVVSVVVKVVPSTSQSLTCQHLLQVTGVSTYTHSPGLKLVTIRARLS